MSSSDTEGELTIVTSWEKIPSPDVEILAYVARPKHALAVQTLIIIPENPGITEWRQEETRRMAAELDWALVVMSPYSRIGGQPPQGPFDTPDDRRRAAFLAMPDEQVAHDLTATASWLAARDYASADRPAVLGFCSGGGQAIYVAATRPEVAACVVSIYGNIVLRGEFTEDRTPIERFEYASRIECPVQMHVGTLDFEIPAAHVDRFEADLAEHGKDHEIYRYPGADHIFSDERHPNYNPEATAEMWPRIFSFLRRCTGSEG
jgi:carboxymethylenebutenolidase